MPMVSVPRGQLVSRKLVAGEATVWDVVGFLAQVLREWFRVNNLRAESARGLKKEEARVVASLKMRRS